MIMSDETNKDTKPKGQSQALRDSIVQRLRAHDAAVRSTLSTEEKPKSTAKPKDQ